MLAAEDIQLKRIKSHLTALQPRDLRDAPRPAIKSCRPNPRDSFVIGRQRRNVGDFGAPGGRSRRWETGTGGETGTKELGREKERENVARRSEKKESILSLSLSQSLSLSLYRATIIKTNLRQIASKLVDGFFERVEVAPGTAPLTRGARHVCVPPYALSTCYVTGANCTNFSGARSIGFSRGRRTRLDVNSAPRARILSIRRPKKVQWWAEIQQDGKKERKLGKIRINNVHDIFCIIEFFLNLHSLTRFLCPISIS